VKSTISIKIYMIETTELNHNLISCTTSKKMAVKIEMFQTELQIYWRLHSRQVAFVYLYFQLHRMRVPLQYFL